LASTPSSDEAAGAGPALPPPDLLAPGEELVAGRRPVEEAFVARRSAIRLLVTPQRRMALEKIVLHATSLRIPIVEVEGGTLTSVAGFDGHQGVALVVGPRRWATIETVLERARERGEPPFVLALDSLEDPQNVGTLLRSAEAAGVHGVIFPTHRQAPLSPAAVKASAGAVEHLLLVPVDDLGGALADLHVKGLRVAGSDGDAPLLARQADLRGPLALVVGSEGQGLGPAVRRRADFLVRIPMKGQVASLNAAVAGSVLLFEILAQREAAGDATPPASPATVAEAPEPAPELKPRAPRRSKAETVAAEDPSVGPAPKPKAPRRAKPAPAAAELAPAATPKSKAARRTKLATAAAADDELLPSGPVG
jgi:23S rRNA (guanosine2251-2'-O)-methyltransferase